MAIHTRMLTGSIPGSRLGLDIVEDGVVAGMGAVAGTAAAAFMVAAVGTVDFL